MVTDCFREEDGRLRPLLASGNPTQQHMLVCLVHSVAGADDDGDDAVGWIAAHTLTLTLMGA